MLGDAGRSWKTHGADEELWSSDRAVLPSLCLDYTPIGRTMKYTERYKQAEAAVRWCSLSAPKHAPPTPSIILTRKAWWCGGGHASLNRVEGSPYPYM